MNMTKIEKIDLKKSIMTENGRIIQNVSEYEKVLAYNYYPILDTISIANTSVKNIFTKWKFTSANRWNI